MQVEISESLDLRGSDSPMVLLLVRRALAALAPGQCLEVRLSSAARARDLERIALRSGDRCLVNQSGEHGFRLVLCAGGPCPPRRPCPGGATGGRRGRATGGGRQGAGDGGRSDGGATGDRGE